MRYLILLMVILATVNVISGQEEACVTTIPSNVPEMDETIAGCTTCGACSDLNIDLPEITSSEDLADAAQQDTDGMIFGNIDHAEIEADLASDDFPFSTDEVIGIGEIIDANVSIGDLVDCVNFNCFLNPFDADFPVDVSGGLVELLSDINFDDLSAEEIAAINDSYDGPIPAGYNSYADYLSDINFEDYGDEIGTSLNDLFGNCDPTDFNCMLEHQMEINSGENETPCIIDRTVQSNENSSTRNSSVSFTVEGETDLFSTRIPGTASGESNQLLPSPSSMNLIASIGQEVDLYNGKVSASIPIHTLTANDLSIPISINLGETGVKVNDLGSEVGTNWLLNAGGSITRIVNNLPDEYSGDRVIGRGRGPSAVLKPCVDIDLGGISAAVPPKKVEWSPAAPNVLRFNIVYATIYIVAPPIIPVPIPVLYFYFTIEVKLNVHMKPDYYTMTERGVGFMHLRNTTRLAEATNGQVGFPVEIRDFDNQTGVFADPAIRGRVLSAANGRKRFEDQTFISSTLEAIYQFFEGVLNLFGDVNKTYSNLDLQADEFSYNLPGYAGRFIIDQNGRVFSKPANDLEITPGAIRRIRGENHLTGFTVETPEGVKYTFGDPNWQGAGTGIPGVEFSEHTTYNLPNYITYPRILFGNNDSNPRYGNAAIDQSAFPFKANVLCYPRVLNYGSTYENLYTVQSSPRYASTWKVTKVESLLTGEQLEFIYDYTNDLQYYSSKNITHKFPNFNANGGDLQGPKNSDGNPLEISEFTNLKAQFNYSAVLTTFKKERLSEIRSSNNRLESMKFSYGENRQDLDGDLLLTRIEVWRRDAMYKAYVLGYDTEEEEAEFGCETPNIHTLSPVPKTAEGFSYMFDDPFTKWHVDMDNLVIKTFCFGVGSCITPVKLPLVLPTFPQSTSNLHVLDEYGSLLIVKGLETDNSTVTDEMRAREQALFQSEMGRSFLRSITIEGHEGGVLPYVEFAYHGDLSVLPKRFSTQQDLWGYYNINPSKSLLPPLKYYAYTGNEVSMNINPTALSKHFSFITNHDISAGQSFELDVDRTKIGALHKIYYPTRGFVEYDYELNDWVKEDGNIIPNAGVGLRVRSKRENTGDDELIKYTGYRYRNPTVVNHPLKIVQSPFDRSDYDVGVNTIGNSVLCNEDLEDIGDILDWIPSSQHSDDVICGNENGLSTLVTTSTSPQNNWLMNGNGYVGYEDVIEILGEDGDYIGEVAHHFISPNDFSPTIDNTNHIYNEISSVLFNNNWFEIASFDAYTPPFPRMLVYDQRYGLEESITLRNVDGITVQETTNSYVYQRPRVCVPAGQMGGNDDFNGRVNFNSDVGLWAPVTGINNTIYDRKYPGTWLVNLTFNLLSNFIPYRSNPVSAIFPTIGTDGLFADHPFKRIYRDYLYNVDQFTLDFPRLHQSTTTTFYDDGQSSNSSTTQYSYEAIGTMFRPTGASTTFSNGQSVTTENLFIQGNTGSLPYVNADAKTYLSTFGRRGGYSTPVRSIATTDGSTTQGKIINWEKIGSNNRIRVKSEWGIVNGNWQLTALHNRWHSSTIPISTTVGEYREGHNFDYASIPTFGKKDVVLNIFLQPESITTFSNDETRSFVRNYAYNDFAELEEFKDENEVISSFAYDEFGRLETQVVNNGRVTNKYTYSPDFTNITTNTSFSDGTPTQTIIQSFNGLGLPVSTTRHDGANLESLTYDNQLRVATTRSIGSGTVENTYEASPLSRLLSTDQGGNETSFSYTAVINNANVADPFVKTIITDPNGQEDAETSEAVQDALGRTTYTVSAEGSETYTNYDSYSRPTKIINPLGELYEFGYNGMGLLVSKDIPNSATSAQWFDTKYRLVASKSSSGATTTIRYDDFNRPINTFLYKNGGPSFPTDIIVTQEQLPFLYNENKVFTTTLYQPGKTWVNRTTEKILDAENNIGGSIRTSFTRDNIGRPFATSVNYPNDLFTVDVMTSYNDNSQVKEVHQRFRGNVDIEITNKTTFDNVLRPYDQFISFGDTPEQQVSRTIYSQEDQVQTKLLGATSSNSFLQRISYKYDEATLRLTQINEPAEYSC
ncbi:MAG: hypothetical protein AAF705_00515, partial [Bacteroidota bacterium]